METINNVDQDICKTTSADGSVTVISINGELGLALSHKLQEMLIKLIDSMSIGQELYIDLQNVEYIASTGVGAFSTALIRSSQKNINFYIYNLKPKVRGVFSILGLMSYFTEKTPDAAKL